MGTSLSLGQILGLDLTLAAVFELLMPTLHCSLDGYLPTYPCVVTAVASPSRLNEHLSSTAVD